MTIVDRSNTNWTPWPRLAGIPQRVQVAGGVAAIMGAAALLFMARSSRATIPKTLSKEWKEETAKSFQAKEREAADPVVMNPITASRRK